MNNHECVTAVLSGHREARQWDDHAVANDLLAQLGVDPKGEAKNAKPVIMPGITEAEVIAHETVAKEAVEKAKAAREALHAQTAKEAEDRATVARDQARAAAARPGQMQGPTGAMMGSQSQQVAQVDREKEAREAEATRSVPRDVAASLPRPTAPPVQPIPPIGTPAAPRPNP